MAIDFDRVERELGVVVPNSYRAFLATAAKLQFNLASHEFYDCTDQIIEENTEFANVSEQWRDGLLAIGPGDGCGNFFVIDATTVDDDQVYALAHDPCGLEQLGQASEFFDGYLNPTEL